MNHWWNGPRHLDALRNVVGAYHLHDQANRMFPVTVLYGDLSVAVWESDGRAAQIEEMREALRLGALELRRVVDFSPGFTVDRGAINAAIDKMEELT